MLLCLDLSGNYLQPVPSRLLRDQLCCLRLRRWRHLKLMQQHGGVRL